MLEIEKINQAITSGKIKYEQALIIVTTLPCFLPCMQSIWPGSFEERTTPCSRERNKINLSKLPQTLPDDSFPQGKNPIPTQCQSCKVFQPARKKFAKLLK